MNSGKKAFQLVAGSLFALALAPTPADEMGVGRDGPNVAPEEPADPESASESLWQELAEWFEVADSE